MNYYVGVTSAIPTLTVTIDATWAGVVLGVLVLVGLAMLAWHASADWRASLMPRWASRPRWHASFRARQRTEQA